MNLSAIIFDCDGVLADTERDGHLPAFNETFAEFGIPVEWSTEEYARLVEIGGGKERMGTLFDGQLRGTRWDGTAAERAASLSLWHAVKTRRYVDRVESGTLPARPGIRRLSAEAAAAGVLLGVASTSAEASVRAVLRHAVGEELSQLFRVFAGDSVGRKKPAPDIYQAALEGMGVSVEQTIAVEDSGIGCQSATAAGLTTVITISAYTGADNFTGAAIIVPDLGERDSVRSDSDPLIDLAFLGTLLESRGRLFS